MPRRPPPLGDRKRIMPHDLDAEAGVLGGILLNNEALSLLTNLETEDFYDHKNKVVFQAMRNLEAADRPIDVITVESEVAKTGKLEAIGGVAYLGELTLRVPTADNVEAYAEIVRTKHVTRQVMLQLSQLIDEAYVGETEGEQLLHDVTSAMMAIHTGDDEPIVTIADLVAQEARRAIADAEARAAGQMVYAGVPTGIIEIDTRVGGTPIGIMSLVIGRPGNGKSTLALQFSHAAQDIAQMPSLLASYEDSGQSFGQRGLAQESGIGTDLIRARKLSGDDLITISAAWAASADRGESLISASGMPVEALLRRLRRENIRRRQRGLKPYRQLQVDYIQAMPMPEWARSRDDGIGYISSQLKTAAVKEDMSVVVYCQLNREVEKRDDHRPRLSDIRECGALEQDGKFVIGLYRPWVYGDMSSENPESKSKIKAEPNELHLIGLKNHQGEMYFDICLFWDVKCNAVYNSRLDCQTGRAVRAGHLAQYQGGIRR
jgi:replicative DNA helicase